MTSANKLVGLVVLGLAAALPVAISCGGGQPEAATPGAATASATGTATNTPPTLPPPATTSPAAGTTLTWKDMNHDQRLDFMKTTVLPKMKAEFAAYDSKRFGNITCGTCHGDGAKDGSFKMPNPKITPKVPNDKDAFAKLMKDQPDAVKFMGGKVVPEMAQMLGMDPYDMKTGKGFGCHECHTAPDTK
jgi:hypothetical protein